MTGFLTADWTWLALVGLILAMHLGHHGHQGRGARAPEHATTGKPAQAASGKPAAGARDRNAGSSGSHRHGCC